jgi:hypothetical protein
MISLGATAASAELVTVYGPVYVTKADVKHDNHGDEGRDVRHVSSEAEGKFVFRSPVTGPGVIVIKNGGDNGKHARVSAAEVEFNDTEVVDESGFNKNVDELTYDVDLQELNEMEVEVKSCKNCELEIRVMTDRERYFPSRLSFPTR